jgi:predicted MPP superfamily phosphohydrolase
MTGAMPAVSRRALLAGAVGGVSLGWTAGVEPRWLETTRHDLPLPPSLAGLRGRSLVQLTDVHLEGVHAAARACVEALDAEPADLLVLTGDIVQSERGLRELPVWLREIRARRIVATLGNWEHWGGLSRSAVAAAYERAGAELLVDASTRWGDEGVGLAIVGLDDGVRTPDPVVAWRHTAGTGARVLLAHSPGDVDRVAVTARRYELPPPVSVLSGHTHGGQVRTPLGAVVTPPGSGDYVSGWYRDGWAPLYVSRGVGTSVVPVRALCRPELARFVLG